MRFLCLAILLAPSWLSGAQPGWETIDLPLTGSYCDRYIPESLDRSRPAPAIVFMHGSGAYPHNYHRFVQDAAESTGAILVLPKSILFEGWGHSDDGATIRSCLSESRKELWIDDRRTAMAGHSSGGAYAIRVVYNSRDSYSGVFTLSAPFIAVPFVADPQYTAPIFMHWGFDDPNFQRGATDSYEEQWQRLGVLFDFEVSLGYGHNDWPDQIMDAGFVFLTDQRRPPPPLPLRHPLRHPAFD